MAKPVSNEGARSILWNLATSNMRHATPGMCGLTDMYMCGLSIEPVTMLHVLYGLSIEPVTCMAFLPNLWYVCTTLHTQCTTLYGFSIEPVTCLSFPGGCQGGIVSWRIHLAVATKGDYFQCLLRLTSELIHCSAGQWITCTLCGFLTKAIHRKAALDWILNMYTAKTRDVLGCTSLTTFGNLAVGGVTQPNTYRLEAVHRHSLIINTSKSMY